MDCGPPRRIGEAMMPTRRPTPPASPERDQAAVMALLRVKQALGLLRCALAERP